MRGRVLLACMALAACTAGAGCGTSSSGSPPTNTIDAASQTTSGTALSGWYQRVRSDYQAAILDMTTIGQDVDQAKLQSDCQILQTDTGKLQSDPPIPDHTLNLTWQSALTNVVMGSSDCQSGLQRHDQTVVNQALSEIATAKGDFNQISGRVTAS
jgi:hypothetical protein